MEHSPLTPDLFRVMVTMDFLKALCYFTAYGLFNHKVTSDTSDFALKSYDSSGIGISTKNMKADIDFNKKVGEFVSNQSGSVVQFPENEYIAYMDEFKWLMDQDEIEMGTKKKVETTDANDLQLSGTRFISVDPHQDSLQFISQQARYRLRTHEISAYQVPYIDVADARISPDSGNVIVYKHAYMKPLTNANITANKVTKYYTLYKANMSVTARKSYAGTGYYDFIDGAKNRIPLYFSNIHVDTSHQTVANTAVGRIGRFLH